MSDTTPPSNGGYDSSNQGGAYGPPPTGPTYGGGGGGTPPPNHLAWAIISTIFCCLPLGIVSIVFAAQVNSKWSSGDHAGAQESSRKARSFALWSTVIGAVGAVLWILLVLGGAVSMSGSMNEY